MKQEKRKKGGRKEGERRKKREKGKEEKRKKERERGKNERKKDKKTIKKPIAALLFMFRRLDGRNAPLTRSCRSFSDRFPPLLQLVCASLVDCIRFTTLKMLPCLSIK